MPIVPFFDSKWILQEDGDEEQYKDEWDCFRQLVTKEGIGSLYSGLVPQLIGIAPEKVSGNLVWTLQDVVGRMIYSFS